MRILVVEDDRKLATVVQHALAKDGHVIELAFDGEQGLRFAKQGKFDLLVLDRMLPRLDGLALAQQVKSAQQPAILFLTAKAAIDERIEGLACADDYMTKPFALGELRARVNVIARRRGSPRISTSFEVSDLRMNLITREVRRGSRVINLQPVEFRLLELLVRHAGQTVTKSMIAESVWGLDFEPKTSVVHTNMSRLRSKIDGPLDQQLIHTVRGLGYTLSEKA